MEMNCQLQALAALPPGKVPPVHIGQEAGDGKRGRVGLVVQPVATPTELSRLHLPFLMRLEMWVGVSITRKVVVKR
jgi:hypothetical protein